ncbi:MAG: ComEC/Rec2 family competence protein [Candidatus Obscuribacterales bacterium]|jgi:ComEC/Rec2-related protein
MPYREVASLTPSGYTPARAFSMLSLCVLAGALLASCGCQPFVAMLISLLPLLLRPLCLWPMRAAVILSLALALSFIWGVVRKEHSGPTNNDCYFIQSQLSNRRVNIKGQIDEVRERQTKSSNDGIKQDYTLIVHANELLYPKRPLSGRILVSIEGASSCVKNDVKTGANKQMTRVPLPGDTVEIAGVLRKPRGKNFSFEFDEAAWLASKGIFARLSVKPDDLHFLEPDFDEQLNKTSLPSSFSIDCTRSIEALRKVIVTAHSQHLGTVSGGLFSSMVLGDRVVSIDQDLKQQFSLVGLSHLLAASGLNLTIIVTTALVLCRFLQTAKGPGQSNSTIRRANYLSTYVPFICVVLFTAFAGAGPSVSRAAIMCLVALWARLAFVRLAHGASLALALLFALTIDPVSILDVGLQLSYGATFGIVYIYPLVELAWLKDLANVWLRALFSLVAVVVTAQIAVLPIQLQVFQQLSILVVPANLLAEPVVVPLTIMGFVSSILAVVASSQLPQWLSCCQPLLDGAGYLCWAIDWLAKFPLDWLTYIVAALARLPLVSLSVAKPQVAHIFVYYLALAAVLIWGRCRPRLACMLLSFSFVLFAAVSYIESPLLQLLCTKSELIVNRGNCDYFVCPVNLQTNETLSAQSAIGKSFVRYLNARGIHPIKAPLVGKTLLLSEEALQIQIEGGQSGLSGLQIVSSAVRGSADSMLKPRYRMQVIPSCSGPPYCRIIGEVVTPLFIPYCRTAMPVSFPLVAQIEAVKSAYLITLRL